jgi:hypothetical protein
MPPMQRDIVFLHVPKTGGSAVRTALVRGCRDRRVLFDYGAAEKQTTPALRDALYRDGEVGDGVTLRRHLHDRRGLLLAGHFKAAKYWDAFHPDSFVTFLRDPIDRLISEYNHHAERHGLASPIEEFLEKSLFRRHVSALFRGVDPAEFGFVGFTETFEDDIRALSVRLGRPLAAERENEGAYRPDVREKAGDPAFRQYVRRLVADDHDLYRRLRNRYDKLRTRRLAGLAETSGYRGRVRLAPGGRLVGYAVHRDVEAMLELEIHAGGRLVTRIHADRYRPWLKTSGRSRSGVGGFEVPLRRLLLAAGRPFLPATATVRIAGTDIELPGSPVRLR